MKLIDQVHQQGLAWPVSRDGIAPLAIDPQLIPLKYVLDEEVSSICARLVDEHFDMLADMIAFARMPSQLFWIERLSPTPLGNGKKLKLGSLVVSEEDGKSGEIILCVESVDGKPIVLPQKVIFDFECALISDLPSGILTAPLPPDADEKQVVISRHFAVQIHPAWAAYYDLPRQNTAGYAAIAAEMCHSLWDGLYIMAFTLLMSSQKSFREVPVELSRLNRSRSVAGKRQLLDYVEVKQRFGEAPAIHRDNHQIGANSRNEPRMHIVRGHFVRKGDSIFWRRSHLRGSSQNMILSKTVKISF